MRWHKLLERSVLRVREGIPGGYFESIHKALQPSRLRQIAALHIPF